ncbi:hypothetical protein CLAFUW4_14694 [Fulvia fulva]|nr:hypothetical protein CLAFUW4_14694 [Fulvia fulva]
MASKVLRTYARVLFEHQAYYLNSEASLDRATLIAKHPVFGPALRILSLFVEEVERDYDLEDETALTEKIDASHKRKMRGLGMPPSTNHEKRLRALDQRRVSWLEQERFRAEGKQNRALRQLMDQIILNGKEVEMALTDRGGCDVKPTRPNDCVMSGASSRSPGHHSAEPIEVIHRALRGSGILGHLVTSLSLDARDWCLPACIRSPNFDGLTYLGLELNTVRDYPVGHALAPGFQFDSEKDVVRPLLNAVVAAATRSLRHLAVYDVSFAKAGSMPPSSSRADVIWLLLNETMPLLESLELVGGHVKIQELIAFARRHSSLQQLDLAYLRVGGWHKDDLFSEEELQNLVGIDGQYTNLTHEEW